MEKLIVRVFVPCVATIERIKEISSRVDKVSRFTRETERRRDDGGVLAVAEMEDRKPWIVERLPVERFARFRARRETFSPERVQSLVLRKLQFPEGERRDAEENYTPASSWSPTFFRLLSRRATRERERQTSLRGQTHKLVKRGAASIRRGTARGNERERERKKRRNFPFFFFAEQRKIDIEQRG